MKKSNDSNLNAEILMHSGPRRQNVLTPIVILSGLRSLLWRLSREGYLKAFTKIFDERKLLEKTYQIKTNESTFIAQGSKHRLTNPSENSKLFTIEVQPGSNLGEDDIKIYKHHFDRILHPNY